MTEVKERLKQEFENLNDKIMKLYDFMCSDKFQELTSETQFLLQMQADAMTMYVDILNRRLEIWED